MEVIQGEPRMARSDVPGFARNADEIANHVLEALGTPLAHQQLFENPLVASVTAGLPGQSGSISHFF